MDTVLIYSDSLPFDIAELTDELELLGVSFDLVKIADVSAINNTIDAFEKGNLPNSPVSAVVLLSSAAVQDIITKNISTKINKKVVFLSKNVLAKDLKNVEPLIDGLVNSGSQKASKTAMEIVKELAESHRGITFAADTSNLWQSPLYIFRKREGYDDEVEILIDVTWSAKPTKPDDLPKSLLEFFRKVVDHVAKGPLRILDFGAGKLRYTLFLLAKGHTVKSVDFKSLYASAEEKKFIVAAEAYGSRFEQVDYPSSFARLNKTFDLVILVNVLNVMPEPLERHFVLYECNRKLQDGGYVLWFCQYGDLDQKSRVRDNPITDGGYTLNTRGRSTFYKDYNSKDEIDRLMALHGFVREELKHPVSGNHALLYKKKKESLVNMETIIANERRYVLGRKAIAGSSDSNIAIADLIDSQGFVNFGDLIKFQFGYLQSGKADAYKFEDLAVESLKHIFQQDFSSFECQYEMDEDRQRVDIKANWSTNSELRQKVVSDHGFQSGWIPIECKNYAGDPTNKEYAQLVDRFNSKFRRFGIMVCRQIQNPSVVIEQCHRRLTEHEYLIIVLSTSDLIQLLAFADQQQFSDIVSFISQKISDVTDRRI